MSQKIPKSTVSPSSPRDTARHPVLDVPGQCLKVRHGHVAQGILCEVVMVGGLTGGHSFDGGGRGGGGVVMCDVEQYLVT